jgi:hypothetical protein
LAKAKQGQVAMTGGISIFADKSGKFMSYTNDNDNISVAEYENMANHPTIALGIEWAIALHSSFDWYLTGTNKKKVAMVEKCLRDIWEIFINDVNRCAMIYGFAPFEKVWKESGGYLVYDRLLPLKPKYITVLTDSKGDYAGLKQEGANTNNSETVYLPAEKTFIYPHRYRFGDLYGMSRLRAARYPYFASKYMSELLNMYMESSADPVKVGRAPTGKVKTTSNSAAVESVDYLNQRLNSLSIGGAKRITLPSDTDANGKYKWDVNLLESTRTNEQFLNYLRFLDVKMLNGILIPETTALAPENGSNALEKGQEGILALSIDKEIGILGKFVEKYLIDPLLEVNFGADSVGTVEFHHTKLSKNDRDLQGRILFALTQNEKVEFDVEWLSQKTGIPFVKGTGLPKEIKNISEEGKIIEPNGITVTEKKEEEETEEELESCNCGHVHLEKKKELSLTEKKVEFDKVDNLFNKGKLVYNKLDAILDDIKMKILETMKPLIKKGDIEGIKKAELELKNKYKNLFTAETMGVFEEAFDLAKREVGLTGALTAEQKAVQKARVQNIADMHLTDIELGMKNKVLTGIAAGLSYGDIENEIKNFLSDYKDSSLKTSVDVTIAQSVSEGREKLTDFPEIELATWSAVLDSVVCPLCGKLDGMTVRVDSADYAKFKPAEVHPNCRCIWIYTTKEENNKPEVNYKEPNKTIVEKYNRGL